MGREENEGHEVSEEGGANDIGLCRPGEEI